MHDSASSTCEPTYIKNTFIIYTRKTSWTLTPSTALQAHIHQEATTSLHPHRYHDPFLVLSRKNTASMYQTAIQPTAVSISLIG
jgi:hypothetical protein